MGGAAFLAQWGCAGSGGRSGRCCLWMEAEFYFLCCQTGFPRTRVCGTVNLEVERPASILLRELEGCHKPRRDPIEAGVATYFPEIFSNDAAVTTEAKVDGDPLGQALNGLSSKFVAKLRARSFLVICG